MHRNAIAALACALLLLVPLVTASCSGETEQAAPAAPDTTAQVEPAAGQGYPSLDLAGYKALVKESAGRILLVCIWSVDCPACQQELPVLEQIADRHDPDALRVVYASLDRSDQTLASFFGDYEPIAEVVRVNDQVAAYTGTEYIPRLVIYDTEGKVSFIDSGFYPEAMLEALLNRAGLAE